MRDDLLGTRNPLALLQTFKLLPLCYPGIYVLLQVIPRFAILNSGHMLKLLQGSFFRKDIYAVK